MAPTLVKNSFPVLAPDRQTVIFHARVGGQYQPVDVGHVFGMPLVAYMRFFVLPDDSYTGTRFMTNGKIESYQGDNYRDALLAIYASDYWVRARYGVYKPDLDANPDSVPRRLAEITLIGVRCDECSKFVKVPEAHQIAYVHPETGRTIREWTMTCEACAERTGRYAAFK